MLAHAAPSVGGEAARHDPPIRAGGACAELSADRRRGVAQPRLCLRHEGPRQSEAGLGRIRSSPIRSKSRPSSPRCGSTTPPSPPRCCTTPSRTPTPRAARSTRCSAARSARWSTASPRSRSSTSSPRRPSRPRTSASCCWPFPATSACCWSSSPTGCTTCARSRHMKPAKRKIIAEETMDIYAPLAGRMGMQWLREELEDHAFKALNPEAYSAVVERLKMLRERNQGLIDEIELALTAKLEEAERRRHRRRPREEALRHLEQDGAEADLARAALRHLRVPHRRARGRGLLPRAVGGAHHLARRARPLQGLHLQPQAERLPVDPHHHRRPAPPARRAADPHRADALGRRIRRGGARAVQGRQRLAGAEGRGAVAGLQRLSLAAPSGRHAARRRQPRGVPRAHQARAVPGPSVLLHAQGAADRAAPRRQPDRLRLCGAHRHRQYLRRRQDQRTAHAARHRTPERRRGRDHLLEGAAAAVGLAEPRRHRQGALGHPARDPRRRARPIRQARPRDSDAGISAPGEDLQRGEPDRGAAAPVAKDRRGRHGGGGPRRARLGRRGPRRVPRGEAAGARQATPQGEAQRRRLVRARQGEGSEVPLAGIRASATARAWTRAASRSGACAATCR